MKEAAQAVGTSPARLEKAQKSADPEFDILGIRTDDLTQEDIKRAGGILGGLLLGRAAEIAFEDIYRREMGGETDFRIIDIWQGRTDTDYRVLNGRERSIYRMNIKFAGSTFRRGPELVGSTPKTAFRWRLTKSSEPFKNRKRSIYRTFL